MKKVVFPNLNPFTVEVGSNQPKILNEHQILHEKSVSDHFCSIILTDFITHFTIQKLCLKMSNQTDVPYEPQCAIKGLVMTQND